MSVNTYLYIAVTVASLWCPIASCSNANGLAPGEVADSIYSLAINGSYTNIRTFRADLLSDQDNDFRDDVFGFFSDSSLNVRAMALFATHTVKEIADSVFADHDIDLSHAVFRYLSESGDASSTSELKVAITQRFDTMNLDEKAQWIVATLPPPDISQYLEKGDSALVQRIMTLLSPYDKARFEASLKITSY